MAQPRSAPAPAPRAWILTHVDLLGCTSHPLPDAMTSHVATTRRRALARMRKVHGTSTSWWELRRFELDCPVIERDERDETAVSYFDHRGRPCAGAPYARARAAFARQRRAEIAAGVFGDAAAHDCAAPLRRSRSK